MSRMKCFPFLISGGMLGKKLFTKNQKEGKVSGLENVSTRSE